MRCKANILQVFCMSWLLSCCGRGTHHSPTSIWPPCRACQRSDCAYRRAAQRGRCADVVSSDHCRRIPDPIPEGESKEIEVRSWSLNKHLDLCLCGMGIVLNLWYVSLHKCKERTIIFCSLNTYIYISTQVYASNIKIPFYMRYINFKILL